MAPPKILLSWSGGKDSAWALHTLRAEGRYEVVALLTTVNERFRRIAIHGVRESLLDAQSAAVNLPLWKIDLPFPCTNVHYETRMAAALARCRDERLQGIAFGDLFLEDIRAFRIQQLAGTGLEPISPLWGRPTGALAREMIAGGLRAHLTCIDPCKLAPDFAGRPFDDDLLRDLPPGIDPCGEGGEFHTFVSAAPCFSGSIAVVPGEIVERDNFIYADLLPAPEPLPQIS
jgi:uncharacterized protein (TIGR00290 family)